MNTAHPDILKKLHVYEGERPNRMPYTKIGITTDADIATGGESRAAIFAPSSALRNARPLPYCPIDLERCVAVVDISNKGTMIATLWGMNANDKCHLEFAQPTDIGLSSRLDEFAMADLFARDQNLRANLSRILARSTTGSFLADQHNHASVTRDQVTGRLLCVDWTLPFPG